MFDEDGSGFIESEELKNILQANFLGYSLENKSLDSRVAEIFGRYNLPTDGKLTYDMFMQLSKTHSDLIYPITQAKHTLGMNVSIDNLLHAET